MNGNNLLKKLNYKKLPNKNIFEQPKFKKNQAFYMFKNMLIIHNISIILQIIMISLYIGFFKINYKNFILFLLIFIFIFDYKILYNTRYIFIFTYYLSKLFNVILYIYEIKKYSCSN